MTRVRVTGMKLPKPTRRPDTPLEKALLILCLLVAGVAEVVVLVHGDFMAAVVLHAAAIVFWLIWRVP